MAKIGYARVSTRDQNLDLQLVALEKAGCEKVYSEHKSVLKPVQSLPKRSNTSGKEIHWSYINLTVQERSLRDLLNIIQSCTKKEYRYNLLKTVSIRHPHLANLMMHIFASLAEFERDLIVERTQAGRKAAMAKGKKMGRPRLKRHTKAKVQHPSTKTE